MARGALGRVDPVVVSLTTVGVLALGGLAVECANSPSARVAVAVLAPLLIAFVVGVLTDVPTGDESL